MNLWTSFGFGRSLVEALGFALQWRVWLLWIVVLAVPAVLGMVPLQNLLTTALDHLPDGEQLARHLSMAQLGDLGAAVGEAGGGISVALSASALVTLLLAPWFAGLAMTAARAQRAPRFGELVRGALAEYPRQLRLLLWGLLVYLLALGAYLALSHWASERAGRELLESAARHGYWLANGVGIVAFLLAHASMETARAFLVVRPDDGGALRAWWRAVKLLLRRPLPSLGLYLSVLLLGLLLAAVIAIIRIRVAPIGWGLFTLAALLTPLAVIATAWARVARLRALAHLAQDEALRRYR